MDKDSLGNIVKWVLVGKPIGSNGYPFTLKKHTQTNKKIKKQKQKTKYKIKIST